MGSPKDLVIIFSLLLFVAASLAFILHICIKLLSSLVIGTNMDSSPTARESWTDGIATTFDDKKVHTDPVWEEFGLFFRRFQLKKEITAPDPWALRYDSWMEHVNAFACISSGQSADYDFEALAKPSGTQPPDIRIKFLFDHLNILDGKFSLLLTFNSLLLIAMNIPVGIVLNRLSNTKSSAGPPSIPLTGHRAFDVFLLLGGLFGISWLVITTISIFSLRRLVWGDLRKTSEKEHVKQLIMAVAKRTNQFRIAIPLTMFNIFLLMGASVTILVLLI